MLRLKINLKNQKSAALIIALLIVTVVGITILGVGRTIVQSTFSTNRYADAVVAEQAAWAGIEDGLKRLRDDNWTTYWPNFSEYVETGHENYQNVIRRNISKQGGTNSEIAGYISNTNIPGISYLTSIADSCNSPFGFKCQSNWGLSDQYYDVRVSGSDDTVWPSSLKRVVNVSENPGPGQAIKNSGFYRFIKGDQGDRIFDLTNYTGTTSPTNDNQKIIFFYDASELTGTVTVEFYVYYAPDPVLKGPVDAGGYPPAGWPNIWSLTMNDHLACHDQKLHPWLGPPTPVQGNWATGNYFKTTATMAGPNVNLLPVYIPQPCDGGEPDHPTISSTVQYLAVRFKFGSAVGKISYGLSVSSNPPGWTSLPDSFIGTGVTRILSTGISANIRKKVEVFANKMQILDDALIPS